MRKLTFAFALVATAGCGDDSTGTGGASSESATVSTSSTSAGGGVPAFAVEALGPHPVGHATFLIEDAARARVLPVEVWYPAAESARDVALAGEPIESFATTDAERETLVTLLETAPNPGTNRVAHAARDAEPASDATFPWVAFSHCFNGTRFSVFTIAERLASHGIAVVAPDHTGGTVYDDVAGNAAPLGKEFLDTRTEDLLYVMDQVLDASSDEVPASLRGRFDEATIGVFGHSFGGVTAGRVLSADPRPRSGLALTVPMENPLLPGVKVADIHVPLLFVLAEEDNSITQIGNDLIDANFEAANPPVWKIDVKDAGHWSVTDICGLTEGLDAGCNEDDIRQTTKEEFTYLDANVARGIGAAYVTAFFLSTLEGDAEAGTYLGEARPADVVTRSSR